MSKSVATAAHSKPTISRSGGYSKLFEVYDRYNQTLMASVYKVTGGGGLYYH